MAFYRWYTTTDLVRAELGSPVDDDTLIGRFIARASSWIENAVDVNFIPVLETHMYDVPSGGIIFFSRPLLELISISDENGTIDSSYFNLYPLNLSPKTWLKLIESAYWSYTSTKFSVISIEGWWGYSDDEYEADFTLPSDLTAATTTTSDWDVGDLSVGMTVRIDDEHLFIKQIVGGLITFVRGVNGTTAVAHDAGADIFIVKPPFAIEQAVTTLASFWYSTRQLQGVKSRAIETFAVTYYDGTVVPNAVLSWLDPFLKKV